MMFAKWAQTLPHHGGRNRRGGSRYRDGYKAGKGDSYKWMVGEGEKDRDEEGDEAGSSSSILCSIQAQNGRHVILSSSIIRRNSFCHFSHITLIEFTSVVLMSLGAFLNFVPTGILKIQLCVIPLTISSAQPVGEVASPLKFGQRRIRIMLLIARIKNTFQ